MKITFDPFDANDMAHLAKLGIRCEHGAPQSAFASGGTVKGASQAAAPAPAPAPAETQAAAPAPAPAPAETPAATGDVELDSRGVPWMEEWHAKTKAVNADGTWRRRRGVDKDAADKAEEAARVADVPDSGPTTALPPGAAEEQPAGMPTGMPTGAAPAPAPAPERVVSFEEIVTAAKTAMEKGADISQLYAEAGVPQNADGTWNTGEISVNETLRANLMGVIEGKGLLG